MANTPHPIYLNRKEVAAFLRCSVRSVINYEQLGYLKRYDRGGNVLYRADEIDLNNFPQGRRS